MSTWYAVARSTPGAGTGEAFAVGLEMGGGSRRLGVSTRLPGELQAQGKIKVESNSALVSRLGRCAWTVSCVTVTVTGEWRCTLASSNGVWGRARCDETKLHVSS